MQTMNTSLSNQSLTILNQIIGTKIRSFKYDQSYAVGNSAFQRVGIVLEKEIVLIDNSVDWFDNYFSHGDYIPFLTIKKVEKEEEIHFDKACKEFVSVPVEDTIQDILLIQDNLTITKNKEPYQEWKSTEGIIFITREREYGFFKETTWLDESLLVYKGHNIISMIESLHKHWDIFGIPFEAVGKRNIYSLLTKETKFIDQTEEKGHDLN